MITRNAASRASSSSIAGDNRTKWSSRRRYLGVEHRGGELEADATINGACFALKCDQRKSGTLSCGIGTERSTLIKSHFQPLKFIRCMTELNDRMVKQSAPAGNELELVSLKFKSCQWPLQYRTIVRGIRLGVCRDIAAEGV